ncbi:hypothetical protein [Couchioplanes azureus]|uniref:hypothetical protein n=1 Tax=Couchioplanes caeruleus TaxID=56438 RepID=UPI00166FF31A|nr:hypothetical protein [Couchioplanes caeruleus]GGQ81855.1 hypothetical protein GCM10010166_60010 [Couchioplanes caeruleus subsp. azureus]
MKMSRLVAVLGVAAAGATLVAPPAASAATASAPGALMGIAATRGGLQGEKTTVSWTAQADVTQYRISVLEGTKKTDYVVPATGAAGTRMFSTIPTVDKCSSFDISVAAENAQGAGKAQRYWIGSLMPSIVVKAKATRGADGTSATFTYSRPQWPGYVGTPKTGPARPDPYHWPVSVGIKPTLTKMVGNQVVTATPTYGGTAISTSLTYTNLDPKRAYVLKLSTSNTWGTCARSDGKILLKAGR